MFLETSRDFQDAIVTHFKFKSWQLGGYMEVNEWSPSEFPVWEEQMRYEGKKYGKQQNSGAVT